MPINNYDDPITPLPVREPSDTALEIRQRLIQDGVIPAKGKAPLTPDLITAIIKLADKIKGAGQTDQGRRMISISDALDVAFKLYSSYAQRMPREIEVDYEFIDDVMADWFMSVLADSIEYIRESGHPLAKNFRLSDSDERVIEAIGKTFEQAPPAEILDLLNQAVDCRKDIWPLIKRAEFYHKQDDLTKAIADASQAIAEARKSDILNLMLAYLERARYRLAKNLISDALDDLWRAFELAKTEMKKLPVEYVELYDAGTDDCYKGKGSKKFLRIIDRVSFIAEHGMPLVKLIADKKSDQLMDADKLKLAVLKTTILEVRRYVRY